MAAAKNVAQNTDNILEYIISYNLKEFAKTLSALSEQDLRGLLSTELTLRHIAQQEFRNNPFVTKLVDYDIPKLSCFHIAALFGRTDMVGLAVTMGMRYQTNMVFIAIRKQARFYVTVLHKLLT